MRLVAEWMTEKPSTVHPNDTLADALDIMAELDVRHVPVVDHDGALVGLISQRDLIGATASVADLPFTQRREALSATKVRSVMVTGIEAVAPDADLAEVGEMMLENKFGCVPVCEGGELVGILTEADFVRLVVAELAEE